MCHGSLNFSSTCLFTDHCHLLVLDSGLWPSQAAATGTQQVCLCLPSGEPKYITRDKTSRSSFRLRPRPIGAEAEGTKRRAAINGWLPNSQPQPASLLQTRGVGPEWYSDIGGPRRHAGRTTGRGMIVAYRPHASHGIDAATSPREERKAVARRGILESPSPVGVIWRAYPSEFH
jgi:hypothetical protein